MNTFLKEKILLMLYSRNQKFYNFRPLNSAATAYFPGALKSAMDYPFRADAAKVNIFSLLTAFHCQLLLIIFQQGH